MGNFETEQSSCRADDDASFAPLLRSEVGEPNAVASVRGLLAHGVTDPAAYARFIPRDARLRAPIVMLLQQSIGHALTMQVLAVADGQSTISPDSLVCEEPTPEPPLTETAEPTSSEATVCEGQEEDLAEAMAMTSPGGKYGNCTKEQWHALNLVVKQECKTNMPRACTPGDSSSELADKAAHFQRCIDARTAMNDTCYGGGDQGHKDQVDQLTRGKQRCAELKEPVPQPIPQPAPKEQPHEEEADNGFLDRMAKATGLTGAALIAYLIVSEGSRVVFPPRNWVQPR